WVVLHRLARAPSCHGFSRPSLAEPDVIDAADLAGDDLVAGAVDGALKRHPLGVLLGFFGVTGREVRLVKFALDQLDLERPHRRTIGPGFDLLAAVDEQVHDGAAQDLDALAASPVIFFRSAGLSRLLPIDDERGLHLAG